MTSPYDVPYGSEWKFLLMHPGTVLDPTLLATDYDDSSWETAVLPKGYASPGALGILTPPGWAEPTPPPMVFSDAFYLRRTFTDSRYGLSLLRLRRDCDYFIWVNGVQVAAGSTPGAAFPTFIGEVTEGLPGLPGVLAVYVQHKIRAGLDGLYLDLAVELVRLQSEPPVVRQWPRDSRGLAAAPRLFPPPRGGRLVGGQQ